MEYPNASKTLQSDSHPFQPEAGGGAANPMAAMMNDPAAMQVGICQGNDGECQTVTMGSPDAPWMVWSLLTALAFTLVFDDFPGKINPFVLLLPKSEIPALTMNNHRLLIVDQLLTTGCP